MSPSRVADPQECKGVLAAHPKVQFVEIFFTSLTGVPRGKRWREHDLQAGGPWTRPNPGYVP